MPGPRFFAYARRIAAYDGILARRLELQQEREKRPEPSSRSSSEPPARPVGASSQPPVASQRAAAGRLPKGATVVPVAAMGMTFPGLFERRQVPSSGATTSDG